MINLESDLVRIRQKLRQLEKEAGPAGTSGNNIFTTYHSSNLDAMPSNPTGDGTTGGWHRTYVTGDNWMSTKLAPTDIEGDWSNPMAIRGLPGADGAGATVYYIKPTTGTALKNGAGTLTIEAHMISGGSDGLLVAGTIKLYDPANNEVTVANGYAAGSDGYTGVLDSTDINLSKVITLKDGPTGDPLDTITLIDIYDGADGDPGTDGEDAIAGSIESDNGLAWTQAAGPGAWTPSGTTTTLTVTFYQGGASIATRTVVITRSDAILTAPTPDTVDGITYTRLNNGSSAITIEFEHIASGIVVSETVYAVAGAADGVDGSDGAGISDDIPWLGGITFVGNTGSGKVGWTAGTIDYGGTQYNITSKAVDDGSTNSFIYWDPAVSTTTFQTTNDLATAIGTGRWVVCKNIGGKAWPAAAHRVLLAGLLQAATLSAISANMGQLTAGVILLSDGANLRLWIGSSGIYVSDDGGVNYIPIIRLNGGVVAMFADYLQANEIVSSHINALAVTTAKINGLAVETGKLADNATQIVETEYTAADINIPESTMTTVQSVSFISEGGLVQLFGSCEVKLNDTGTLGFSANLYRGDTFLTGIVFSLSESGTYRVGQVSYIDSPGAGSFTYNLKVNGFIGAHTARYRRLYCSEYKGK